MYYHSANCESPTDEIFATIIYINRTKKQAADEINDRSITDDGL